MIKVFGIFWAYFWLDYVYAIYTKSIQEVEVLKASVCAGGIIFLAGIATIGYVNEPLLLIPSVFGAVAGTVMAMKYSRWLTLWWYEYLFQPKVYKDDWWFTVIKCRALGHPESPVFYNSSTEHHYSCTRCGDEIG